MNTKINQHRDTDYSRRACNVLCWIIGAVLAWIAVVTVTHNDLHILNYFVKIPL